MGRKHRILAAGGLYHVTCRGVRQLPVFYTERDNSLNLALLRLTVVRFTWRCHAYCHMPNHLHMLIETEEPNLSAGMHWLNTAYARSFNKRHGYAGHVFDRRFNAVLIEGAVQFAQTARYIDLNPVRAGRCAHPADYAWSSYRFNVGLARSSFLTRSVLLELFGSDPQRAAEEYAKFVLEAMESYESPGDGS